MARSKGFDGLAALRGRARDAAAPVATHAALEAAIAERPDDESAYLVYGDALERAGDPRGAWIALCRGADAAARGAYLAEHELYLLGRLAPYVRDGVVRLTWRWGFACTLHVTAASPREDATQRVLDVIDACVDLPSCRYLRELVIRGGAEIEVDAVAERLASHARPVTLSAIHIERAGWTAPQVLRDAFPRLAEGDAVVAATLAAARAIPLADDMAWHALPRLDDIQALARLNPIHEELVELDVATGLEVDPDVLVHGGARVCGGGRVAELVVPDADGGLFIDGDVLVDGVFEQPFRSCPTIVFGDLRAEALALDGHLVVMGDLDADVVYGCCSNYATFVFGAARVGTLLLEREHVLVVHGPRAIEVTYNDEVVGQAVERYFTERGLALPRRDASSVAAALRRARARQPPSS